MEEKKINISISEGDAFYAHELAINFNPTQFVFDFKSITPRVDMRSKEGHSLALKHNVVMIDPYHAKNVLALLTKMVNEYEKQYGKIDKPKAIKKFEDKNKKVKEGTKDNQTQTPNYFG